MPTTEISAGTYRTVLDELKRVATTATRERAELAEEALADFQRRDEDG